jgi:hypothetical protein
LWQKAKSCGTLPDVQEAARPDVFEAGRCVRVSERRAASALRMAATTLA